MLDCKDFFSAVKSRGVNFFSGVPDSLLKAPCAYIQEHTKGSEHIIAANEGAAVSLAMGHFLGGGNPALVYMQNSGLGNTVNPITSMVDPEVYGIPMLILIGWRGEPGVKDEPQHVKMGAVTIPMLEAMDIEYKILPNNIDQAGEALDYAFKVMSDQKKPFALVVKKDTFSEYKAPKASQKPVTDRDMTREDAIKYVLSQLGEGTAIVSTTGKASREVYEYRQRHDQSNRADFLCVGGMGHTSQIALGLTTSNKDLDVVCLDGDGSVIMHMGSLSISAHNGTEKFKHIVLNNGAHDSVGGQPTVGLNLDFVSLSKAVGYKKSYSVKTLDKLKEVMPEFINSSGPSLLEIQVNLGSRADLGRPKDTPQSAKLHFMENLNR